ncbi:GNAT family N-acetyltransferase [Flexivirga oryzae]|uniref:Ribosomal protein S18 acetylase RimI-like enzyme n=1 Tax=Flexivirga oryzae TaxID=1794944 RepID=A0A839NE93_9MICO|nr:GNAT family N-acetyltransferase [Flexivirga oryzae]MBB2892842.1 ribosomal protein S18 acetylase RimI-like enzyme [Flexivirga oryzae]
MPDTESTAHLRLDELTGISWRPFPREELPDIAAFYAECERYDDNPERTSLEKLQEFWDSPRSVPEEDTLVGRDQDGRVVATAWAGCNRVVTEGRGVYLGGAVRPDRRGEGIGDAVLSWELAHGRAWDDATRREDYGPLVMLLSAPTEQTDVRDLATRHGLPTERYFFEMTRSLEQLPDVRDMDGVHLTDWDASRSDEVHVAMDEAFRDHWGHTDTTPQMWQEEIDSHAFRPAWTVLAIDDATDRVVGAAMNCAWEQDWEPQGYTEGYTDQLGVLSSHRGRGVAKALLAESMRRFKESGMQAAGLGVDTANASGALGLYERLGYRPSASTCMHQLTR